jgi:hypothetical protein
MSRVDTARSPPPDVQETACARTYLGPLPIPDVTPVASTVELLNVVCSIFIWSPELEAPGRN